MRGPWGRPKNYGEMDVGGHKGRTLKYELKCWPVFVRIIQVPPSPHRRPGGIAPLHLSVYRPAIRRGRELVEKNGYVMRQDQE